jgi:hypothetical protein
MWTSCMGELSLSQRWLWTVLPSVQYVEIQPTLRRNILFLSSGSKNNTRKNCLPPAFSLVSFSSYSFTMKIEATCSSEISVVFQWTTWGYITEDSTLYGWSCTLVSCREVIGMQVSINDCIFTFLLVNHVSKSCRLRTLGESFVSHTCIPLLLITVYTTLVHKVPRVI